MLLQDLCRRSLPWDEEMNNNEANRWSRWTSQLQCLGDLKIRRSLVPPDFGEVSSYQLHHFADANQTGYAAVAAQLDCKIRSELDLVLCDSVFWTDSMSVLKYIRNLSARYQTFVNNRVSLMLDLRDITAWRYVNTSANPADLASRGLDVESLLESLLWLTGPEFMCQEQDSWPALPDDVKQAELNGDLEVKQSAPIFSMVVPEPILVEKIAAKFSS
ncbi:uncharacterized protein [Palaemon carinicauda]|uniref:uncharacterized protein n=1 Tax=Palaemon carinicauda TaxID=392227 RepID=UPI0035B63E96